MSEQQWHDLFVTHYFLACRELVPDLITRGGGSIIMTASHTVWLTKPDLIAYNSTKAAIIGFMRSLAEAVGKHRIRVNAVAPAWTMTDRQLRQYASRNSALSYEHAGKIEAQLKTEVAELMATAEGAKQADLPDGLSLPDELARHEERLRKLAEARGKLKALAKKRFKRETAEHRESSRRIFGKASPLTPRGPLLRNP
jgi:NAD(P)-dependent dehydrogenase (short-subunit alcohol dehydrogenase family)